MPRVNIRGLFTPKKFELYFGPHDGDDNNNNNDKLKDNDNKVDNNFNLVIGLATSNMLYLGSIPFFFYPNYPYLFV